jgi:hypothetical protein
MSSIVRVPELAVEDSAAVPVDASVAVAGAARVVDRSVEAAASALVPAPVPVPVPPPPSDVPAQPATEASAPVPASVSSTRRRDHCSVIDTTIYRVVK